MNPLLSTDSYKHSHPRQLPPGTKRISSYIEARRGDEYAGQVTQFFGMQAFLRKYMAWGVVKTDKAEAAEMLPPHGLPFEEDVWDKILEPGTHKAHFPLEIQALPEGMVVPRGTPLVQVQNTNDEVPSLTSFFETPLLRGIWYPNSVATNSFLLKAKIYQALQISSDDPEGQIGFKLHDFGARGVSSGESAGLGGMAHLVNFLGTDTLEGMEAAHSFYDAKAPVAFSIPASEHSTMTAWGRDREVDAYSNMIDQFGDGMFSVVSDSYDLWHAVTEIFGKELKDKILAMPGTLVVRPDSGDPVQTPLRVLQLLWAAFGGTINGKGYKVLNPNVRVIQGDGMDARKIHELLDSVMEAGFSIDNIAFGMGGGLLQGHMRDDMRFAMKANAIDFGDGWQDVQKNPATDPTKASKAGRQAVVRRNGQIVTIREDELLDGENNLLRVVYRNGELLNQETFEVIRERAHKEMIAFHQKAFIDRR